MYIKYTKIIKKKKLPYEILWNVLYFVCICNVFSYLDHSCSEAPKLLAVKYEYDFVVLKCFCTAVYKQTMVRNVLWSNWDASALQTQHGYLQSDWKKNRIFIKPLHFLIIAWNIIRLISNMSEFIRSISVCISAGGWWWWWWCH